MALSSQRSLGEATAPGLSDLYFQFLRQTGPKDPHLEKALISEIVEKARRIILHPTRPMVQEIEEFERFPGMELDLEASLEESPFLSDTKLLRVERRFEKEISSITALDTSASMAGEKHLLGCVAVAVLLLEMPKSGVFTFSSSAQQIQNVDRPNPLATTLKNFLSVRPRGFTNIGAALEGMLGQMRAWKRKVGILVSDGRSTEGKDPLQLASKFDFLVVLHLGGAGSDLQASLQMAEEGHGMCLEVETIEELPRRLYEATRWLLRGQH